ncbi:uncharacterized protein LOC106079454 isoform X1 [Biomphalaria glabrata]|uniref:Uncharacterized protein LOC106079454 isoform X1 n=1 Tax=Biomphalaria glabrata TaxID=6526 RepID=A0A2C9KYC9_BIOGL|nr:uncharacterized protein LOC106079454 isoform X1 [Biomphalaria glabrata]
MEIGKLLKYTLIAAILIVIAFILIVVGVASPGWVYFNSINSGIKLQDYDLAYSNYNGKDTSDSSARQAAYALCVISTLGAATALTAVSIDVLLQLLNKMNETTTKILPLVTLIAANVGGGFGIIGSIIHVAWYASKFSNTSSISTVYYSLSYGYIPGYSFFLTIIGSIILIAGGGLAKKASKGGHIGGV